MVSGHHTKRPAEARLRYPLPTIVLLLGCLYVGLFQSYRAYEIDNPWYLSFSRSFWVNHVETDFFLNGIFPDGMGGTRVFGKIPALVQGGVLNSFSWMPVPAMLLSCLVVLCGLSIWYAFLRNVGLPEKQCAACILALGVTEPFVGMADRFRYEPYSFLLLAIAFWCVSRKNVFLALLASAIALEVEPAAGMVFISTAWYLWRSGVPRQKLMIYGAFAILLFAALYWSLHHDILLVLRDANWHRGSSQRAAGGFLRAYFLDRKRHLAEFVLLVWWLVFYLRRRREAPAVVRHMAGVVALTTLCSFAMRWPTPAYMVFWYPAALVVVTWGLFQLQLSPWMLPAFMALLMLPQYGALAWINRHDGYRSSDIDAVRDALQSSARDSGLDPAKMRIMGDYSLWFAHPEHYRALARTNLGFLHQSDLFLCFDEPLRPPAMVDALVRYCADVQRSVAVREVRQVDVRGHRLHILLAR